MRRLKPRSALPLRARNQPVAQRPEHVQRPVPDHAESGPTAPARQPVRRKAHLPDPGKPVLTLPVPAHALEGLRWAQRPDGPARTPPDVLCFPAPASASRESRHRRRWYPPHPVSPGPPSAASRDAPRSARSSRPRSRISRRPTTSPVDWSSPCALLDYPPPGQKPHCSGARTVSPAPAPAACP